ncbi:MAG: hypothetical protein RIR18_838 [Pseudomonadota bacterium]|jgi:hypothetical protein
MSLNVRLAPALLVLVAFVMFVGGVLGVHQAVFTPIKESLRTRDWVAMPAILDDIKLLAADGTPIPIVNDPNMTVAERASIMPTGIVKLAVRYHYYIGEEIYDGNRYGLFEGLDDGDAQRYAAATMHRKQEIQVWINPKNPSESILNRDLHWGVMAIGLPLLATALVGLVILGYGAKTWWQMWQLAKKTRAIKR